MGKLDTQRATDIISGIASGCQLAQCALLGGETAEMPGFYPADEYDLAGFTVGVVDNSKIIDGTEIRVGHKLIGIASSGLHSNGYSLARKVCFETLNLKIDQYIPELGKTVGEELLTPTKIYAATIKALIKDLPIHGIAHITGGGISENIIRTVPQACSILIRDESWDIPPIFSFLQKGGNISAKEMSRTFNMGIGMILVVPDHSVADVMQRIEAVDESAYVIGEILDCKEAGRRLIWD
jgi:phosphoribosylformylglycinamidine cyclo-ligase